MLTATPRSRAALVREETGRRLRREGAAALLHRAAEEAGRGGLLGRGALDDLVQLAAVEPDAPGLGAVVDLHALPLAHGEVAGGDRAGQGGRGPCGALLSGACHETFLPEMVN